MKESDSNVHAEIEPFYGLLFHVTPTRKLESIFREGLRPQIGPRSALIGEENEMVYFFTTLLAVEDALCNWLGEELDKEPGAISVLAIDGSELHLVIGAGYELACPHLVPPAKISLAFEDGAPAAKMNEQVTKGSS